MDPLARGRTKGQVGWRKQPAPQLKVAIYCVNGNGTKRRKVGEVITVRTARVPLTASQFELTNLFEQRAAYAGSVAAGPNPSSSLTVLSWPRRSGSSPIEFPPEPSALRPPTLPDLDSLL